MQTTESLMQLGNILSGVTALEQLAKDATARLEAVGDGSDEHITVLDVYCVLAAVAAIVEQEHGVIGENMK